MDSNSKSKEHQSLPLALLLGLFVPGLGHIYFGQKFRALLVCLSLLGCALFGSALCIIFSDSSFLHILYFIKSIAIVCVYAAQLIDVLRIHKNTTVLEAGEKWTRVRQSTIFAVTTFLFVAIPITLVNDLSVRAFQVPMKSMAPQLREGDFLLVDTFSWITYSQAEDSLKGQVVLYMLPKNENLIQARRIIAVAGDRIRLVRNDVYVNDVMISKGKSEIEPKDHPDQVAMVPGDSLEMFEFHVEKIRDREFVTLREKDLDNEFNTYPEVQVPPDHFFVLGDHRDRSLDSRHWGFLPRRNILGLVRQVYISGTPLSDEFRPERTGLLVR